MGTTQVFSGGAGRGLDGARKVALLVGFFAMAFLMWGLLFANAASPAWASTITVDSLSDTVANDGKCTLREAITSANNDPTAVPTAGECANGSGSDVIHVGVTGTVNLTGVLPNLASNMQIGGPGAHQLTVRRDSGGDYRIFHVVSGVVSISEITISNGKDTQSSGGGIRNAGGTLTITDSTISGNSAGTGGGIANFETLTVTGSTISGNSAGAGGGIFSDTNLTGLKTTITNSTISGNTVGNGGGGVANADGLTVIEHSTITSNTAANDQGSGVLSRSNGSTRTEVLSSIISANTNTDVDFFEGTTNPFDSNGYNLIGDGNATAAFNQTGDQPNVGDPKLGALADNGGPTNTHALLATSTAIDAIPSGTSGCGTTYTKDQRGVSRPQGSACDIGAFEPESIIIVNSLNDDTDGADGDCTLREAIIAARDNTASGAAVGECAAGSGTGSDVIGVGVTGTVNLTGALPSLSSNLQIEGPGADQLTVRRDTGGDYRIFFVTSGSVVSISGMTIANGDFASGSESGGGVFNDGGDLTITDSTISGNSVFSGNGGGLYNNAGDATVTDSTISGNSARGGGGGVYNSRGDVTVTNSTVSANSASAGGGVWSLTDLSGTQTTTITNSTISGNFTITDTGRGGGVFNAVGLTVIENSTITSNTAGANSGSGVGSFGNDRTRTEVFSTIVAANPGTDVDFTNAPTNSFDSGGYNLIGDGNATGAFDPQSGDQTGVTDPKLRPLADNGGPTLTHLLNPGSAAIDAASADCPPPATDQRGVERPKDGDNNGTAACDIGAAELDPVNVSINDARETEGDSGLRSILFTVSLNEASARTLTVNYATGGGTAIADEDYVSKSGTLTFAPGETSKEVSVSVVGDFLYEADETFNVDLSGGTGDAVIVDEQGVGTITDDDSPSLSIGNAQVTEGNSGTTNAVFTVYRLGDRSGASSVSYATQDGSATTADNDYTATSGTLNFAAGQTRKQVTVLVNGDTLNETSETFTVKLSGATNATIEDEEGTGAIFDDDGSGGDSSKPVVIRTTPRDWATGVALGVNVSSYFSEAMDAGTINQNTVKLFRKQGSNLTRVPAAVTYDAANKRAILNPNANLVRGATYLCSITSGAQDLAANPLDQDPNKDGNQNKRFTFTTRR